MHELSTVEVEGVSGGFGFAGAIFVGSAIGLGGGLVIGLRCYLAYKYIQQID